MQKGKERIFLHTLYFRNEKNTTAFRLIIISIVILVHVYVIRLVEIARQFSERTGFLLLETWLFARNNKIILKVIQTELILSKMFLTINIQNKGDFIINKVRTTFRILGLTIFIIWKSFHVENLS